MVKGDSRIYAGHRARMRERLSLAGAHAMATYELLEMLLYFPIARRDTHPAAKLLLLEFGSLEAVLRASCEELSRVDGIGSSTAEFISRIGKLIGAECEQNDTTALTSERAAGEYLVSCFKDAEPACALVSLDNSLRPISVKTLFSGKLSSGALRPEPFIKEAVLSGAARVIIAASSPFGIGLATEGELAGYSLLADAFFKADIPLVAGFLISGERYTRLDTGSFEFPNKAKTACQAEKCDTPLVASLSDMLAPVLRFVTDEPQRAATALAHSFKTKSALFSADEKRLESVCGSHTAAELVRQISYVASRAGCEKVKLGKKYSTDEIEAYIKSLFLSLERETLYALSFSDDGALISRDKLSEGTVSSLEISPRAVLDTAVRRGAHDLVLAHNHPSGTAVPSDADIRAAKRLREVLGLSGISLTESYIVAEGRLGKTAF